MHIGTMTWSSGPSMAPHANTKRYIDFAAANGLAESWSKAGTSAGTATGSRTVTHSRSPNLSDYDLPELARYAPPRRKA